GCHPQSAGCVLMERDHCCAWQTAAGLVFFDFSFMEKVQAATRRADPKTVRAARRDGRNEICRQSLEGRPPSDQRLPQAVEAVRSSEPEIFLAILQHRVHEIAR